MHLIPVLQSLKAFIDDVVLHASASPYASFQEELSQCASEQVQWWDITGAP